MHNEKPLSGKYAIITGATSGIGLASAAILAAHGAHIIGVGRNAQRCAAAESQIRTAVPEADVKFFTADLSLQVQIRRLALEIQEHLSTQDMDGLDILVNNAGTYSQRKVITAEDIEFTFATNHLAPFLLTHELLPFLRAGKTGRVITVSSDSHYKASINPKTAANPSFYFGLQAYARSKLANVLFTAAFNKRFGDSNVHAYAVDPGLVRTDIALKGQPLFSRLLWKLRSSAGVEPEVPAKTILYLATEPSIQHSQENYWYNSQPKRSSKLAGDPQLADELWRVSCQLCKISDW
jgi:NAD(P)-dependent dehydrogenase (short-subunit alcohol dehydrogenase family)